MKLLNKLKRLNKIPSIIFAGLIGFLFLTGCSDDDEPVPVVSEVSLVSIYHGSPDADGLDIIVGPTGQINALPFEFEDFSNYLNFYSGNRHLTFVDANNEIATVIDTTFTFEVDEIYSLFIADSLNSIEVIKVNDIFPSVVDGESMIRFAHLSPDAPAVDIYADGIEILSDVTFKDVSDFIGVSSGRETIEVRSSETGEIIMTVPNLELLDQEYYTVIVNGFVNPPAGNTNELGSDIIRL